MIPSPEFIAKAKAELEKVQADALTRNLPPEDRELLRKYPKHTLAAARMIDATPLCRASLLPGQVGHESGADFQQLQYTANGEFPSRQ